MNIEFKNIFLASLRFGNSFSSEVILAKDQGEAIQAINDYYADPEIAAISSIEEMITVLDKFKEKKDLILIQELDIANDGSIVVKVSEHFGDLMKEKSKFDDKQAILFNENSALFTILNSLYYIQNSKVFPIIGKSYE